ncbi:hypothetical protein GTY20_23860 [Streptomyces sp. SID4946]|nr:MULTISPECIES: hypothetical protein [unclassified Streptomyces]MYQ94112.1 hypothetical protein [Streptomyces sp. SID4946]
MSNVSVSTVVVVQALPGQPHALLVALVYGLAQKVSARRAVAKGPPCRSVIQRGPRADRRAP